MVDLVKIRKKAREKQEAAARGQVQAQASAGQSPAAVETGETPRPTTKSHAAKVRPNVDREESRREAVAVAPPAPVVPAVPVTPPVPVAEAAVPAADPRVVTKLERFKERAGRLRDVAHLAGATAEANQQVVSEGTIELLTFEIAGEHYAIDIENIVEIVPPRTATRVPNADPSIVGILSLRGTIVTLVDVRRRLRHAVSVVSPETRIVVVEHGEETLGFEVDRVFRVVKIASAEVAAHPVVHASEIDESIRGVFRQEDALTILLDFDKLLDRGEMPRNGALESRASQA